MVIPSAHGLALLPSLVLSRPIDRTAARGLNRFVLPGVNAGTAGASLAAAMGSSAPTLPAEFLHTDQPARFGLEPLLEDLSRTADAATARFALRRMEYRSNKVRFEGPMLPWRALGFPLLLGSLGLFVVHLVGHSRRRRAPSAN